VSTIQSLVCLLPFTLSLCMSHIAPRSEMASSRTTSRSISTMRSTRNSMLVSSGAGRIWGMWSWIPSECLSLLKVTFFPPVLVHNTYCRAPPLLANFSFISYYRCFSASDTAENSDNIIQDVINDTTGFWAGIKTSSGGKAVCGEWSAALAPTSLDQSSRSDNSSRGAFAAAQLAMFK
jgi:hypothetical protein